MRYRLGQSLIAVVLCDYHVRAGIALPIKHARSGFVADDERNLFVDRVLFSLIDLHGRMISRRSKQVALFEIRGVKISSRIVNERYATRRDFDAQRIVVAMRA